MRQRKLFCMADVFVLEQSEAEDHVCRLQNPTIMLTVYVCQQTLSIYVAAGASSWCHQPRTLKW